LTYDRWASFVERRHRTILVASLAVMLLSGLSLRALRFDFDVLDMLPTGTPAFDDFKRFVGELGELDELVILIEGDDPVSLRALADRFAAQLAQLPEAERVQVKVDPAAILDGVLGQYVYNYLPEAAFARLESLLAPGVLDAVMKDNRARLQMPFDLMAARLVQYDPLGLLRMTMESIQSSLGPASVGLADGYVSSPDGRALLLFVRPSRSAFDIPFTTRFMESVRRCAETVRAGSDVRVGYTGTYAYTLEDAGTIRRDVQRYTVLALIGILAVFYAAYRSFSILPFVTYPLLLTTLPTFALSLVLFDSLNAVSISFTAILYGLSIDSGVHYYTRLLEERRGADMRTAVARALQALGGANIIASTTTAVAFGIIGLSALAAVRELGILTAVGMLINVLQFFVIYPALSFMVPSTTLIPDRLDTPRLGRLAESCGRNATAIALLSAGLLVFSLYGASRIRIEANLPSLRPGGSEAQRVEERMMSVFGYSTVDGAILTSGPTLEPLLQQSERITGQLRRYQAEGLLRSWRSVATLLPPANTQRSRLQRFESLPRDEIVTEVRAAMVRNGFVPERFDRVLASFEKPVAGIVTLESPAMKPFELILDRYIRAGSGGFTVATYVEPAAGVDLDAINARLRQDFPAETFALAGRTRLESELTRVLRLELVVFLVLAGIANLALVVFNFRSLLASIAVLATPLLVIATCLAAMALCGVAVGPVNLIVFPLILGIGVDNCVYLAERYVQGESLEMSVRNGGRAMVVASLTTIAGFGFLGLSRYPALSEMGYLTGLSLVLCLVGAFVLVPALLALAAPRRRGSLELLSRRKTRIS
jgi:predicted exporter